MSFFVRLILEHDNSLHKVVSGLHFRDITKNNLRDGCNRWRREGECKLFDVIHEKNSAIKNWLRLADTNESHLPDEGKTKDGSSNKRSGALHDGTKGDASEAINFLRVLAKLSGEGPSL